MRRAIVTLLVLLSFGLKAQVYQAMPQAGYGPVKRMLFDSVLTIPLNINQLRNITGGRDAGQIRYNVSDSGLYVFTGYTWIKANLDSVNLSNRINGKLNISDTAYMLSWYMRKTDTLSLSNRINLRVKYTDTAAMLDPYLRKLDTASLSRRIDEKQNIIKLTTNFKSGAATLIRDTLNIPKYSDTLQDNYVPYVGAIKDVDLGAYQLNANSIKSDYLLQVKNTPFSITPTSDYTSITPDKTGFVFYTSWLQGQSTYTQSNRFNYANQAQQNNTREYNLPVRNGTLALVEDTVNLSNRINLKADKATVLTINGVGYDLSANRTWTIPTFDSTSISNRINLKLNISDTASMLSPYLRKADTSSLSNRINQKADKSTTLTINGTSYDLSANRSWTIPTVDTTSLSNRINLKVNISDTAAMLNPYLRKVDTTNAFLTSVSQPNDSTLSFVKGSTLSSYIIRASTQGSATKLITNVYNNSGAPILKGSVVYINGAHSSNLPTIALALASNEATSAFTYGVVENDIPNNTAGVVVQNGVVTGLNLPTATYSDGQTLYLSPTVAGGYTLTKVIAPNHYVAVGTVTRAHPTFGTIQVAIRNGFQLDELSDVLIAAVPLDSTVLQFSRVDSLWHDVSITSAIGSKYIKPTDTTSLSNRINAKADALSGTTNTVPKFTSGTTIGNSNIKDNGNAVSVSTTAGSFGALQVGSYNGNILMNTTNSNGGLIFQNTSSSNKLWDFTTLNNDLVFNESNIAPVMILKAGGNVVISNLSGTGSRMVVADANGVLSTQAITGVDTTSLSNRINLKLNISDTASMLSPYLRKADTSSLSNRINTKQNIITLTTTGTSGAATFSSNTLNIPQYQAAGTYVTSVTGTSPIVSSGGTTPAISIPAASSSVNGYLSSTDWTTFNGKESALTFSSPLVRTTNAISIPVATTSVNGYLSATDWTTFNGKQNALTNPTTGTGTANYHAKFTGSTTLGNSLIYDDATNVGIGNISPEGKLTVQGTSVQPPTSGTTANSLLQLKGSLGNELNLGSNTVTGNYGAYIQASDNNLAVSYQLNLQPNGGNVIIGSNTDAGYKLDVTGTGRFNNSANNATLNLLNNNGYPSIINMSVTTATSTARNWAIFSNGTNWGDLEFKPSAANGGDPYTTGTVALRLASTGAATFSGSISAVNSTFTASNGVSQVSARVIGSTVGNYAEIILGNDTYVNSAIRSYSDNASNYTGHLEFSNFNAGTRVPFLTTTAAGAATFSSLGTGTVTASSGTLSTVSDSSFKIADGFIEDALPNVMNLKPRYFYWKDKSGLDTTIRQLGFYAQEVNSAIGEEAANTPKKDSPWGITDRSLIAFLTKAIQELSVKNDALIKRIETLENK